ncbi:unnamed protein product [Gadus morhua 'NCC']
MTSQLGGPVAWITIICTDYMRPRLEETQAGGDPGWRRPRLEETQAGGDPGWRRPSLKTPPPPAQPTTTTTATATTTTAATATAATATTTTTTTTAAPAGFTQRRSVDPGAGPAGRGVEAPEVMDCPCSP